MKTSIKIMLIISVLWIPMICVADALTMDPKIDTTISDIFWLLAYILVIVAVIGWCVVGIKAAIEKRHMRTSARVMMVITVLFILSFLVGIVWLVYIAVTYSAEEWGYLIPWMLYGICVIIFAIIAVLGWIVVGIKSAISKPKKEDE